MRDVRYAALAALAGFAAFSAPLLLHDLKLAPVPRIATIRHPKYHEHAADAPPPPHQNLHYHGAYDPETPEAKFRAAAADGDVEET